MTETGVACSVAHTCYQVAYSDPSMTVRSLHRTDNRLVRRAVRI
jgi:hypothetical protein